MSASASEEAETVDGPADHVVNDAPAHEDETAQGLAAQSRRLRNSIISLVVFFAIVAGLLLAVPGLRSAGEKITDAKWGLGRRRHRAGGALVHLLRGAVRACVRAPGRSLSRRLSLAELAVNSVVSASGLGGIALGAWVLSTKGVSVERIAKRSVLLFVMTSAVNVSLVVVIGVPMWLGVLPGSRNPLLTLLPAAAALATIVGTLRRRAGRAGRRSVAAASTAVRWWRWWRSAVGWRTRWGLSAPTTGG